ncbi:MAG TPA: pyridoxamine 5'-phosphate oxidase family protein [Desulfosarcina sp.]|nr:pyridoxamine 5'-phosphate oxidase family protein [Desulfosarcina sp.]
MDREKTVKRVVHALLRQQQLGVLSTSADDVPYASLVAFAASVDDRHIYFATPRATRKFANMTANARVALLVNNSINHPADFHQAKAVTAVGNARPIPEARLEAVRSRYLEKHPYLESFANAPSCVFLKMRVDRYILVERFQNVSEYRIEHAMDPTP